jgi:putative hydrolase of the HAD superfamily
MDASSPRFRGVLFDFFGTLTRAVHRGPAHARLAHSLGCDPATFLDALDHTFYARASGAFGAPADALRRVLAIAGVTANATDEQIAAVLAARVEVVRADGPLREEAVPLLAALRRDGLRTAVVSDCWYELPEYLPSLPIAPLLDASVFSVEVGHCKPHPAMYLAACAALRVDPAECLYLGDGGSCELSGARAVGMTAVQLAAPDLAGHLVFHPDPNWDGPRVGSLPEFADLLRRLPGPVLAR